MKKTNKNVRSIAKKTLAFGMTTAMIFSAMPPLYTTASETRVNGTAPFANTWLVSGPFTDAVVDEIYQIQDPDVEVPGNIEKLTAVSAKASSTLNGNAAYGADKALDGKQETYWASDTRQGVTWDSNRTLTVDLKDVSTVTSLKVILHERDGKKLNLVYKLLDKDGAVIKEDTVENFTPGVLSEVKLNKPAANVKQVVFIPEQRTDAGNVAPNHLGFNEVEVYGAPGETIVEVPETEKITPVLGEAFGTDKNMDAWEYFDDRVFNRNMDDYNDLMGLFDVKHGEDTLNKYAVASLYVYSEKAQDVKWQFAGSGKYKLFVNDAPVGEQASVPGDVRKSGTKYSVTLKEGWNKLLVQIQHVNPNKQCNLFGFYSRLCDKDGNKIEGLTYSVNGDQGKNDELKIMTQGLNIDKAAFEERNKDCTANEYPENTLPYAYEKNPYVALTSVKTSGDAGQASAFSFQAAGGAPGYKWEITKGELPGGLKLNEDGSVTGTVEAGAAANSTKDYKFTVQVTDKEGKTAEKEFTMTAKPNPAQWFEEGRMSALSHCTGTIPNLYDPNYNYDQWAQTAKEMGLTMLSSESYQNSLYWWPSPNADLTPNDNNRQYKYGTMYQDENGEWHIKDRLMQAKEAAERYGLHFGTYLSPQRPQTDIQGLVERYDPWYIFVDGNPQSGVNLDIAFSSARNYNDRVLFNTNPSNEVSDQDLTLMERPFWYSQPYTNGWEHNIKPEGRYFVHEEWNDPYSTALDLWKVWAPGGDQMRDSWPDATKELIDAIGHGYVMNHDLSISASRGCDNLIWNGEVRTSMDKDNIYMMVPIDAQQMSDMRIPMANWLTNEGKPDLHESLFGTMPYYIQYTPKAGWHTQGTRDAFFYGEGPEWGYSMYRDQYVYLHMIENYIGKGRNKTGFTGQDKMENVGPFDYEVENVTWLNEGKDLKFTQTEKDGKYFIEIDTSSVKADPIDTIIKIETKDPTRNYKMTDVKVFSSQTDGDALKLRTECYMNDFTSVFADAEVSYTAKNSGVVYVEADGTVRPVGDGTADILVTAKYNDGVNEEQVMETTYSVQVRDGKVSANMPLTGVGMFTNDKAFWSEVFTGSNSPVELKGYTQYGGTIDLLEGVNAENVTYHYAKVDGSTSNPTGKITINEVSQDEVPFEIRDGQFMAEKAENADKYYCYWADVTVGGKTYTSSRNYITLMPDSDLAAKAETTATSGDVKTLSDGIINDATGGNLNRWTSAADDENPAITYDLGKELTLTRINLFYNRTTAAADAITYDNAPKQVKIEYSTDGKEWTTGNTISKLTGDTQPTVNSFDQVPTSKKTSYAWEADNIFYNYPVNEDGTTANARYVRISFPGGGQNGTPVDLLEARVFGYDASGSLQRIEVEKTANADGTEMALDIKGYTGEGDEIKLSADDIRITSSNADVAAVEGNVIKAVKPGTSKIVVKAVVKGFPAKQEFYVKVDAAGKISQLDYLQSVDVKLDNTYVDNGDNSAISVKASGKLHSGADADLAGAEITAEFDNDNLTFADGKITAKETLTENAVAHVTFKVTLDGVTLESEEFEIAVVAKAFDAGKIEAEDGIIKGDAVRTEPGDGGTAVAFIKQGDVYTYFVNSEKAAEYEVSYRVCADQANKGVQCYVNGELADETTFKAAGNWTTFSTQKQKETIKLNKGLNTITLKPVGSGYLFNFNWFELAKTGDILDSIEDEFAVTVNGETTKHHYNDKVAITAPEKEGYKFAGWKVDDKIVSYEEAYTFYVTGNMKFVPTYVEDAESVKKEAQAMLSNVFATKRADDKTDVTFVGELVIPEGYKLVNAGLIWSSKADTELIVDGGLNPNLRPTFISKISDTNQFSVTIKGMPQGKSIRGSIFATITNGTDTQVLYSTEDKVTAK